MRSKWVSYHFIKLKNTWNLNNDYEKHYTTYEKEGRLQLVTMAFIAPNKILRERERERREGTRKIIQ